MSDTTPETSGTPEQQPGTEVDPTSQNADPNAQPPAGGAPASAQPEMVLIEVNGEKLQVTKDEAIQFARKGMQADDLLRVLKEQPDYVLQRMGIDPYDWAEKLLTAKLQAEMEDSKLTPEQRELRDLKAKMKEREEADLQAEIAAADAQYEQIAQDAFKLYGIPVNAYTLGLMTQVQAAALDRNKVLDAKALGAVVKKTLDRQGHGSLDSLEGDALLDKLGADKVAKILAAQAARQQRGGQPAGAPPRPASSPLPGKFTTPAEGRSRNREPSRKDEPAKKKSFFQLQRELMFSKDK